MLDRYGSKQASILAKMPSARKRALAYQKETVGAALAFAGIDKARLSEWQATSVSPTSFLDGLPEVRTLEDAIVAGDLMHVPGFELIRSKPYVSAAVFESERTRLTVVLANHLKLERQLGVDLIYYNETYKSFVFVQYKVMEPSETEGAIFRLPNAQLSKEIKRMDEHLTYIRTFPSDASRLGYRVLENPFFLKLCSRIVFEPDDTGLASGMYLPLDYWKLIESDETLLGSKGGRQVTFRNLDRYFDNTSFISLVAHGWIGTNIGQSAVLKQLIRDVQKSGRTLTLAVKNRIA